jgi:hypothetical protein
MGEKAVKAHGFDFAGQMTHGFKEYCKIITLPTTNHNAVVQQAAEELANEILSAATGRFTAFAQHSLLTKRLTEGANGIAGPVTVAALLWSEPTGVKCSLVATVLHHE